MKLSVQNLMKSYSGRKVVKDVSFEVKQGEIVGLLGPNGAGKTTSFYMTVGLIKPNGGAIFLDNKEITNYPMYKRAQSGIGYLAQEASVFRKLSIEDNILSVLQMTKLSKKEQLNKMESLIEEFGLSHIRKNRGDLLSGGERRRTEIARALATDPSFILYTSLVALVQDDMKKLIAYSSVAHMGYVTMGIFAVNQQGIDGAIFQMLSHGFISGALFLCVGVIYDRMHTREIQAYGGLVNVMPSYALIFMFFTMANVGLPGTSGFVGEFLTLVGIFQVNTWVALFATSGVILSAAYALWLYRRVVMGDLIKEALRSIKDMSFREKSVFAPLIFFTLLLGIYPALVLDIIGPSVEVLVANYHEEVSSSNLIQTSMVKN